MKVIFFLIFTLIVLSAYYMHYFVSVWLPSFSWIKWCLLAFNVLGLVSFIVSFVCREFFPTSVLRPLMLFGTSWEIIFIYLFMGFLVLTLLRFFPEARELITDNKAVAFGFLALIVSIFTYGYVNYNNKVRVEIDVEIDKHIDAPLKIVGISDLHLGYTIGKKELSRWVDMINKEKPDLILIAGDIIDGATKPVLEANMQEELDRFEAKYGVYAVLGNHEYMGSEAFDGRVIGETNITLLRDTAVLVAESIYIIGRDDRMNRGRKSLNEIISNVDKEKPMLLLDHQPHELSVAESLGVDFQLSGHTHRGQVFPLNLIVDKMFEKSHGYMKKGYTHYYISSGLGIWGGKFRIGTQSEYVCINLRGKNK